MPTPKTLPAAAYDDIQHTPDAHAPNGLGGILVADARASFVDGFHLAVLVGPATVRAASMIVFR